MFDCPMITACFPTRSSPVSRQQAHAAVRRARTQHRALQHQPADVVRMKAVDVLARVDALGHSLRIDLLRQRQLDQDPVHRRVGIQLVDQRQQLVFRRVGRQVVRKRQHVRGFGEFALVAHVDLRGRVFADQHDGEPGPRQARRDARRDALARAPRSARAASVLPSRMRALIAVSDRGAKPRILPDFDHRPRLWRGPAPPASDRD